MSRRLSLDDASDDCIVCNVTEYPGNIKINTNISQITEH